MLRPSLCLSLLAAVPLLARPGLAAACGFDSAFVASAVAPQDPPPEEAAEDEAQDPHAFTLENLFPDDGLFGPAPGDPAFARSGRFAAWLHRPRVERRHGRDLYLLEVATGEVRRITSPTVMAEFCEAAREVVADRKKRAKQAAKAQGSDRPVARPRQAAKLMHTDPLVLEDDAKAEKAPRWHGVSSFTWAPEADELLFVSGGDVYHLKAGDGAIERLTKTSSDEDTVRWLPDGGGYTYLSDGALHRVRFGSHLLEEIGPKLASDESLVGYRLSPDGQRAVFLARKGKGAREGGRRVKIARYRDRFMEVQEVPRHVSDDPLPDGEMRLYLYALDGAMRENGPLYHIHTFANTGPRDIVRTPEWSPDSSRVAFAVFAQETAHVEVLEAIFPEKPPAAEKGDGPKKPASSAKAAQGGDVAEAGSKGRTEDSRAIPTPARCVYRFLHDGGPNTPRMIEPWYLGDSRHIVLLTELSGFRHLHVLDPRYQSQRQLTSGNFEVYPFAISEDRTRIYATATREHPSRLDTYSIDTATGEMTKLSTGVGYCRAAAVSDDGRHAIVAFAAYGSPEELYAIDVAAGAAEPLTDTHTDAAWWFTDVAPEFFEYENRHGHVIHGHVFRPEGFRPEDHRPLLLYVYGGPLGSRKQVVQGSFHADSYLFARYMTQQHGFVTCTIDPRGMSGYGGAFEKANYEQVGRPQVEDLVDGVRHLIAQGGIDPQKVAIHGWSFGGFQTQMCLYTEPEVFRVGIAGAGPTEWENYNSWYSTGTIGPSREGHPDLAKFSLLPLAGKLQGKLLLVHGMEDSNVLYQDTVRVYRELLKAGKETLVELFLDPTGGHGLGGDVERLGRARKYEEFLVRNLGSHDAVGPDITATPAAAVEASGTR